MTRLAFPILVVGFVLWSCGTPYVRSVRSPPETPPRVGGERTAGAFLAAGVGERDGGGGWRSHPVCRHHLARLGELLDRHAREVGASSRGGGLSGLDSLQRCAERYPDQVTPSLILCPLDRPSAPARLPNGVLRVTHRSSSFRARAEVAPGGGDSRSILLYEARAFDGDGRWVLFADSTVEWLEEREFRRLAREQNLYGLPPELQRGQLTAAGVEAGGVRP